MVVIKINPNGCTVKLLSVTNNCPTNISAPIIIFSVFGVDHRQLKGGSVTLLLIVTIAILKQPKLSLKSTRGFGDFSQLHLNTRAFYKLTYFMYLI